MEKELMQTHKTSTIAIRTIHHTTKNCNRACFATQTKLFLKNFQRFKKNKKRNAQPTLNDTENQH